MAQILASYASAVEALKPHLVDLPSYLVAIDGRDGSGKTTLGRYLAWHFNITLLETDLFLSGGKEKLRYYDDQILRIVRQRLANRPIIVEGIAILELLDRIGLKPDFLIYVQHPDQSSGRTIGPILDRYEAAYAPGKKADLTLTLDH